MHLRLAELLVGAFGTALYVTLFVRAVRNRYFSTYPRFAALTALFLLATVVSALIGQTNHPLLYWDLYWTTELVQFLLEGAVLIDVLKTEPFRHFAEAPLVKGLQWLVGITLGSCALFGYWAIFRLRPD